MAASRRFAEANSISGRYEIHRIDLPTRRFAYGTSLKQTGPNKRDGGIIGLKRIIPPSPFAQSQNVTGDQHGTARPQGTKCDLGAIEADYIFVDGFE